MRYNMSIGNSRLHNLGNNAINYVYFPLQVPLLHRLRCPRLANRVLCIFTIKFSLILSVFLGPIYKVDSLVRSDQTRPDS